MFCGETCRPDENYSCQLLDPIIDGLLVLFLYMIILGSVNFLFLKYRFRDFFSCLVFYA
jgi:hypothetical protein